MWNVFLLLVLNNLLNDTCEPSPEWWEASFREECSRQKEMQRESACSIGEVEMRQCGGIYWVGCMDWGKTRDGRRGKDRLCRAF